MSNADRLLEYFRRQYEAEEGTVEDNLSAMFAPDAVYRMPDGSEVAWEALVQAAHGIRNTPASERMVEVTDFVEEGDVVRFRMRVRAQDLQNGGIREFETYNKWRFNADGMVVEALPEQAEDFEGTLRSLGADV